MNAGLAQLIERRTGIQLNVLAGGGLENPTHVNSADSDFGTSVDILARAAYAGMEPYEGRRHSRLRLF
jgi:TRAP-type uncharacterized transport system substrate-binding protein